MPNSFQWMTLLLIESIYLAGIRVKGPHTSVWIIPSKSTKPLGSTSKIQIYWTSGKHVQNSIHRTSWKHIQIQIHWTSRKHIQNQIHRTFGKYVQNQIHWTSGKHIQISNPSDLWEACPNSNPSDLWEARLKFNPSDLWEAHPNSNPLDLWEARPKFKSTEPLESTSKLQTIRHLGSTSIFNFNGPLEARPKSNHRTFGKHIQIQIHLTSNYHVQSSNLSDLWEACPNSRSQLKSSFCRDHW